jgi:mono/diheme cytochrome c family protein
MQWFQALRSHVSNLTKPILASFFLFAGSLSAAQPPQTPVDFNRDIAPIFEKSCVACHNANLAQAKLRLDSETAALSGGVSGPVIVAGKSVDSLLVKRILGTTDAPRMPMGGAPLSAENVQLIRRWIDEGNFSTAQNATTPQPTASAATTSSALFAAQVRPILASRCYVCHGPETQQNGLRLDSLAAVLKGSDSGRIVVPGHSDQSRLMRRLQAQERPLMPYGGPPLSTEEIAVIRKWIDGGAPGPDSSAPLAVAPRKKHWAYIQPVRPALPNVSQPSWVRNGIDAFILARLDKEGLRPSPEADKTTLIRRVYLDLIGLPPSPQEVDAFLSDQSPTAYEKVVDRLLASPQYGERWARPWLDLARYADTNGYEKDSRRTAWEYRDWVIRALNSDMSFKEFTIEQIAGDMLPNPTKDQIIATGFHRNTMLNQEGGVDPEEYYWYEQVDRVNTTASVWLGSTLGCAQCHNHKFDPFTQKDYYRFLAFYGNSKYKIHGYGSERYAEEPELELPTPDQAARSSEIRAKMAVVQKQLDTETPALREAQESWEVEMRSAEKQWQVLAPVEAESAGGATLTVLPDGSVLATGKNPQADSYTIQLKTNQNGITAVRLEVLPDESLPNNGPGRDPEGNFFLSALDVNVSALTSSSAPSKSTFVSMNKVVANESQSGYSADGILSKEPGLHGWAIDTAPSPDGIPRRFAVFVADKPFGFEGGSQITIRMKHQMRHSSRNVGRFRIAVTSVSNPAWSAKLPARLWPVLETKPEQRSTKQSESLEAAYREESPLLDPARKQLADLTGDLNKLGIATAMVMEEKPGLIRPATYIRERGSFLSRGEEVYADVPTALSPLPKGETPNRLALAQWLVSEDNPLTARVTVNRFWETMFGHGLVETSEDFGTQGELPSHPELLDFLATSFMDNQWSMKKIQRLMVTSATYRQSSLDTPELIAKDPYNRLYARGPRFRLEAEVVHDLALSVGGLLSSKMYGPSVFPYQPEGIWDLPYNSDKWVVSPGDDRYRRSVYTFMRRSAPYPSMATFDAPSREFCTVRRVRTNTPLQALTTLNDPFFFEAACAMAVRMVKQGGDSEAARIAYGFRLVVSRAPTQAELDRVLAYYREQLTRYGADTKAAAKVIGMEADPPSNAAELASWTLVANVLLNMDETLSKD